MAAVVMPEADDKPGQVDSAVSWPELLEQLLSGTDLKETQATAVMDAVMSGSVAPTVLAAVLVALRAKPETPAEVRALSDAMIRHARPLPWSGDCLDVVGTGGDRANTVNVSTMTAIVCAAAGARVVKHGNRAASSQCGSADVLQELGITIDAEPAAVAADIEEFGLGCCFAPVFHPAMKYASVTRRELGIRTVFNILGPLSNPGQPTAMLIGCAHRDLAGLMAAVMAERAVSAYVVRGVDGLDEVSVTSATEIWDSAAIARGQSEPVVLDVTDLGIESSPMAELAGGDAAFNAEVARRVLAGDTSPDIRAARDAVSVNSAVAMLAWRRANGEKLPIAGEARFLDTLRGQRAELSAVIASGAPAEVLERWRRAN